MEIVPIKIQIISIIASLGFLFYVVRLIIKGALREEYSIIWVFCTLVLVLFSFWRNGLEVMAQLLGVYNPPSLMFMGAIFAILVYLLHLSIVASRLQHQNKKLTQELGLLKELLKKNGLL